MKNKIKTRIAVHIFINDGFVMARFLFRLRPSFFHTRIHTTFRIRPDEAANAYARIAKESECFVEVAGVRINPNNFQISRLRVIL